MNFNGLQCTECKREGFQYLNGSAKLEYAGGIEQEIIAPNEALCDYCAGKRDGFDRLSPTEIHIINQ